MISLWFRSPDEVLMCAHCSAGGSSKQQRGNAMRKIRRIEITIETDRVLSISRRFPTWCTACAELTVMVRVDEAAALAGVRERTICWRMEAGQLHFKETPEGVHLICLNSLLKSHGGFDV